MVKSSLYFVLFHTCVLALSTPKEQILREISPSSRANSCCIITHWSLRNSYREHTCITAPRNHSHALMLLFYKQKTPTDLHRWRRSPWSPTRREECQSAIFCSHTMARRWCWNTNEVSFTIVWRKRKVLTTTRSKNNMPCNFISWQVDLINVGRVYFWCTCTSTAKVLDRQTRTPVVWAHKAVGSPVHTHLKRRKKRHSPVTSRDLIKLIIAAHFNLSCGTCQHCKSLRFKWITAYNQHVLKP